MSIPVLTGSAIAARIAIAGVVAARRGAGLGVGVVDIAHRLHGPWVIGNPSSVVQVVRWLRDWRGWRDAAHDSSMDARCCGLVRVGLVYIW